MLLSSRGSASNIPMFKKSTVDLESVKFGLAPSQDLEAEQIHSNITSTYHWTLNGFAFQIESDCNSNMMYKLLIESSLACTYQFKHSQLGCINVNINIISMLYNVYFYYIWVHPKIGYTWVYLWTSHIYLDNGEFDPFSSGEPLVRQTYTSLFLIGGFNPSEKYSSLSLSPSPSQEISSQYKSHLVSSH